MNAPKAVGGAAGAELDSDLSRNVRRGLSASLLGNSTIRLGSFLVSLVLARILSPQDFGLYAVALSASQFLVLVNDGGVIAAMVQWRGRFEEVAGSAAFMSCIGSLALYIAFWFLAPLYASFAAAPEATSLLRLITLIVLIDGATAAHNAHLWRSFEQTKFMGANLAGFAFQGSISIWLAISGYGPFSFAVGQVVGSLVTGLVVIVLARIGFPIRPDWGTCRKLLFFGLPLAASLGLQGVLLNVDYIIVGRLAGAEQLGYYMLAFNISSWIPGLVGAAIAPVSLAAFSRLAERGTDEFHASVRRAYYTLLLAIVPFALLLIFLARDVVSVLYGSKWMPSSGVLQVLAALMVARMVAQLTTQYATAIGRTAVSLLINALWLSILVPTMVVLTSSSSALGAGIAHSLVAIGVVLPMCAIVVRSTGVRLGIFSAPALRLIVAGVAASMILYLLTTYIMTYSFSRLLLGCIVVGGTLFLLGVPSATRRDASRGCRQRLKAVVTRPDRGEESR